MDYLGIRKWLLEREWTPEQVVQFQDFYHNTDRVAFLGAGDDLVFEYLPRLPTYEDLKEVECGISKPNAASHQPSGLLLPLLLSIIATH